jgi:hypothetical protein
MAEQTETCVHCGKPRERSRYFPQEFVHTHSGASPCDMHASAPASTTPRHPLAGYVMTPEEKEEQRRSFALGNVGMHNPDVTREVIDRAADSLASTTPAPPEPPGQRGEANMRWENAMGQALQDATSKLARSADKKAEIELCDKCQQPTRFYEWMKLCLQRAEESRDWAEARVAELEGRIEELEGPLWEVHARILDNRRIVTPGLVGRIARAVSRPAQNGEDTQI